MLVSGTVRLHIQFAELRRAVRATANTEPDNSDSAPVHAGTVHGVSATKAKRLVKIIQVAGNAPRHSGCALKPKVPFHADPRAAAGSTSTSATTLEDAASDSAPLCALRMSRSIASLLYGARRLFMPFHAAPLSAAPVAEALRLRASVIR